MKLISTKPDFFDIIHTWAVANPFGFFFVATVILMVVCYVTKDLI